MATPDRNARPDLDENERVDPTDDRLVLYRRRRTRFESERATLDSRSRRIARARGALALAGSACVGWALIGDPPAESALLIGGLAMLGGFLGLVVWHASVDAARARTDALVRVNEQALARMARDWDGLPDDESGGIAADPTAADLDLVGRASLMQLLGVGTTWGRDTLRTWLLAETSADRVRERQAEVRELAAHLDFRQQLAAHILLTRRRPSSALERLVEWTEDEPWLTARPAVLWVARLLGGATVVLILLQVAGVLETSAWGVTLVVNLVLIGWLHGRVQRTLDRASNAGDALREYAALFELIASERFESGSLASLQTGLLGGATPPHVELRRLDRINGFANMRRSAAIFHFPIHALTLWDVHVLDRLERWQRRVGPHVRGWFEALATVDALSSLAGLQHDHPGWCVPIIDETGTPTVRARGLGHPLLTDDACVVNDVAIGPPGSFLLVTGSNMSGKSTLLRAVGLNVLLAHAGGPACAVALSLPMLRVETSMRIHDSLESGVSYFMAALARLRDIVEAVRLGERDGRVVLYLLDEILQGTNTAERQTATRAIVRSLVEHRALGAVTTHDLSLVETPWLRSASRPVHFTETIDDAGGAVRMTFDYRLRPGLATSKNALALMRMMGLDPDRV